jgi:hypothetical protein
MITSFAKAPVERAQAETKRLGTKWLTFCIVGLPVGGVLGLLMSITAPLVGIIVMPVSVLQLVVAYGLHRRKLWAWRWNWILILVSYLAMSMPTPSVGSSGSGGELLTLFILKLILGGLIWIWPNFIYWRKRKVLFN